MIKGGISILAFLLAALALSSTSCESPRKAKNIPQPSVSNPEPIESWSSQEGMEHLIAARTFAFGGTNIAGTSDGELAIHAILKSPEAPSLFKTAYAQATAEGQLYALCGIHAIDRSSFEDYASPLRSQTRDVATISGRIATNEPITNIVQRIAVGDYDQYITNRLAAAAVGQPATAR